MQPDFAREYAKILQEYDDLLREMMQSRQSMLLGVTAAKLEAVLKAMNAAQADTMRLEKLDARRFALQSQNGLARRSIPEVLAQLPPPQQSPLLALASSISHQVEALRFLGEKSIGMAQCNLAEFSPGLLEETLQAGKPGAPANAYKKQSHPEGDSPGLARKI